MSDSLTQTAQAKEALLASIRAFTDRIERDARQGVYGEAGFPAIAVRCCVDDFEAAVLADHDAQTRQAFEAGWMAAVRGQLDPDAPRLVAPAYAAYLATLPAQKAHVTIEIVAISPETTKDRILREQAQARLDKVADDIARAIEGRLQPISYEEAVMGAVLLDMGRSSQPDSESVRRFEDAKRAVTDNLNRVFKDGTP